MLVFASAAAAASLFTAPAIATVTDEPARVVVQYGDLNLDSDAGMAALHHRLKAAVNTVCGTLDERNLSVLQHIRQCHRTALASVHTELAAARAQNQRSAQAVSPDSRAAS
jgi:UrcA family protein